MTLEQEIEFTPSLRKQMDVTMAVALIFKLKEDGVINEKTYQACKKEADKMIDEVETVKS